MRGCEVIAIGGSAGAIEVVTQVAASLPADFPAAILLVIHFPGNATSVLPAILSRAGALSASHATDGGEIIPGHIHVAQPGLHLLVEDGRLRVRRGPKVNGHRPAIDPLFRSMARAYGQRGAGVVLSGNLDDGAAGLAAIKAANGIAIVQDPASALYAGMPKNAIAAAPADYVVEPDEIAPLLTELARNGRASEVTMQDPEPISPAEAAEVNADRHIHDGVPSTYTCPECHGTLWESDEGSVVQFRCRVGHAYSAENLFAHQSEQLEAALWTALRALEEHGAMARRMAARAASGGRPHSAATFTEAAVDAEHHAAVIRAVLVGDRSADLESVPDAAS